MRHVKDFICNYYESSRSCYNFHFANIQTRTKHVIKIPSHSATTTNSRKTNDTMNNHRPWIHLLLSSAILLFIGNKHCISQAFSPSPCCCLRLATTTTSTSTTATTRLDASRSTFSKHPKDGSKSRGASSSSSCVTPIFQSMPKILPKLLVFDLDNTLWTPYVNRYILLFNDLLFFCFSMFF